MYTYQWYQVPVTSLYNVFGSEIVKSTLSIYNSQSTLPAKASGVNFMIALANNQMQLLMQLVLLINLIMVQC
ncbi:hypothetical protein J6P04_03405 [bacterium]|nr:hypothetical protein [bacterium]